MADIETSAPLGEHAHEGFAKLVNLDALEDNRTKAYEAVKRASDAILKELADLGTEFNDSLNSARSALDSHGKYLAMIAANLKGK